MVDHVDAEESAGLAKSAGERDILSRRLGLLTRVVVNQHDGAFRSLADDGVLGGSR